MRYESASVKESTGLDPTALSPANPREKWLRKRTQVKLRVRACCSCVCWTGELESLGSHVPDKTFGFLVELFSIPVGLSACMREQL